MNELWSTQTLVADSCTLMASSFQLRKLMLRMITFRLPLMLKPQPEIVADEPTPRMLLLLPTLSMPEQLIVPDTRITAALDELTAERSADSLVTVVEEALPPPVVPPFWVAQPTRPVGTGPGGGVVGGGVVGGVVVGGGVVPPGVVGVTPPVQDTPLRVKLVGAGLLELFQEPLNPNETFPLVGMLPL